MFLKKKRSDKSKSVKFLLTPRPQKDPLAADFEAPQHVLVPKDGTDIDQITERLRDFDPQVFPSKEEEKVGMLERAHRPDVLTFDPDILEAMSKDFDYEDPNNVIDDDFMEQAGGLIEDDNETLNPELLDSELFDDAEVIHIDGDFSMNKAGKANQDERDEDDSEDSEDDDKFAEEETKSVFTNYSMTSSVLPRNQGLQQIDEHFERLYEKEYADDTEIGALDLNEVKGHDLLTNIDQINRLKREVKMVRKRNHGDDYEPEVVSDHHKNAIIGDGSDNDEDLVETEVVRRENRVDCESILSYNSNLYNHPKLIIEQRKRTTSQGTSNQMDVDSVRSRSEKGQSIASSRATILAKLSNRPSNETPEEKRARKKALKLYRHERRQERKQNQMIFKQEQASLVKQQRANTAALKLV